MNKNTHPQYRISDIGWEGIDMNGYCMSRSFLTKEEKLEMLKEYKQNLEKEAKGVGERIKDLENAS